MSTHRFSWKDKKNPQGLPTACVVRYGAFGDVVQAASLLAQLKKDGYHVTFMTQHPSHEIVTHDPNIDRLIVQTMNQVPMAVLGHLWLWWQAHGAPGDKPFDKWVNLTESVENNLLAIPGNIKFAWSPIGRHAIMNVNYIEHQHRIGDVPFNPTFKFYSTDEEKRWRDQERARMKKAGIEKYILWALAGSSRTHKVYPHAPAVWDHVLQYYPEWGVVTVGDESCKVLEEGYAGKTRMWLTSGKYTIRQVMLMLETADVVVGPETGTMSAAGFYPMPKICLLTHSTIENLTRDWVNCTSIWAPNTHCPGRGKNEVLACHKMLPNFEGCLQNPQTLVAQCSTETKPEWMWEALQTCMRTGIAPKWSPPT